MHTVHTLKYNFLIFLLYVLKECLEQDVHECKLHSAVYTCSVAYNVGPGTH